MAQQLPGGDESIYLKGAEAPVVHPQQKGHEEMQGNPPGSGTASAGRNTPLPAAYPLTGTKLPQGTEAGTDPGRGIVQPGNRRGYAH